MKINYFIMNFMFSYCKTSAREADVKAINVNLEVRNDSFPIPFW